MLIYTSKKFLFRECFLLQNSQYFLMTEYSTNEKMILVQYAIKKYENEEIVIEKLKAILSEKEIQRNLDTLIGTQRVRRIGPEILENNESHTEIPDLPDSLKSIVDKL